MYTQHTRVHEHTHLPIRETKTTFIIFHRHKCTNTHPGMSSFDGRLCVQSHTLVYVKCLHVVCMCVSCMWIHVSMLGYACVYMHVFTCMCIICTCLRVCVYMYICMCICTCLRVCVYMYIRICICTCLCVCVYMYVFAHMCTCMCVKCCNINMYNNMYKYVFT